MKLVEIAQAISKKTGYEARPYGKTMHGGDLYERVFLKKSGIDSEVKIYLDYDADFLGSVTEDNLTKGSALRVFGGSRDHLKQIKHGVMMDLWKSGASPKERAPCENWEDVIL